MPAGTGGAIAPLLVRSTELTHTASAVATTVTSITHRGWKVVESSWTTETLPAVSFTYGSATLDPAIHLLRGLDDLPNGLDTRTWSWMDLDGEGLDGDDATDAGGGCSRADPRRGP